MTPVARSRSFQNAFDEIRPQSRALHRDRASASTRFRILLVKTVCQDDIDVVRQGELISSSMLEAGQLEQCEAWERHRRESQRRSLQHRRHGRRSRRYEGCRRDNDRTASRTSSRFCSRTPSDGLMRPAHANEAAGLRRPLRSSRTQARFFLSSSPTSWKSASMTSSFGASPASGSPPSPPAACEACVHGLAELHGEPASGRWCGP